ncbi:TadE/TadG family type IV pilus assembly protein [Anaerocolumna cellulosilytica]|uniref:TadE/TadG family type IV pilus assembly protein n=1 Tax=Anaerocolumna cellulosilytica TaxID=433286 RepID=UPI0016116361|nr:TadE/TadG family type IV pilus assembly protein [Anaerocolumna cellulosilytica]MBB5196199.1 Flp pilus assembly protein TadG [Anaerocolumna cellulosilytica]
MKGSYTVEASLLFPIIFFIIIWLIYLGFYLHDKNRLNVIVDDSLLKARYLIENETDLTAGDVNYEVYIKRGVLYGFIGSLNEKEVLLLEYVNNQLKSGLLIADNITVQTRLDRWKVGMEINADFSVPIIQVQKLFRRKLTLTAVKEIPLMDTEEFLRMFDIFSGVAEKIPAAEKVLNGLSRLLKKVK